MLLSRIPLLPVGAHSKHGRQVQKATFENCTLIGNNDKTYNAEGWNDFATIVINEDAMNAELTFNHQSLATVRLCFLSGAGCKGHFG